MRFDRVPPTPESSEAGDTVTRPVRSVPPRPSACRPRPRSASSGCGWPGPSHRAPPAPGCPASRRPRFRSEIAGRSPMLNAFLVVTILVLLGILGVLIDIAWNLRRARKTLQQGASCAFVVKTGDRHHGFGIKHIAAFSIWCYEQGKWTLLA